MARFEPDSAAEGAAGDARIVVMMLAAQSQSLAVNITAHACSCVCVCFVCVFVTVKTGNDCIGTSSS